MHLEPQIYNGKKPTIPSHYLLFLMSTVTYRFIIVAFSAHISFLYCVLFFSCDVYISLSFLIFPFITFACLFVSFHVTLLVIYLHLGLFRANMAVFPFVIYHLCLIRFRDSSNRLVGVENVVNTML